ncbi:MAG: FAD-dependent monooxygenase [Hyphomicrobiales bacterium]|nr:FAD-dependent monooxygenase [Hyphomicrobiales bacterium]
MSKLSLGIAGGGIAGLSAALALAQTGHDVAVYERAPQLSSLGAGVQLGPNACRILAQFGLLDQVSKLAISPKHLFIHRGSDGTVLVDLPLQVLAAQRWNSQSLVIHRGDLHSALLEAARAHPRISISNGARVVEAHEPGTGIDLHLDMHGAAEIRHHDALVAADGVGSQLRGRFDGGRGLRDTQRIAWRAVVPAGDAPAFARSASTHLWLGPAAHLVHYPLSGGTLINVVATTSAMKRRLVPGDYDAASDDAESQQHLAQSFENFSREARQLLASVTSFRMWPLFDAAPLSSLAQGHIGLAGDAAHPMVPFLAQGACQAIEDAGALAAGFARHPQQPREALVAYSAMRLARASRVQAASRRQATIYHLSGFPAHARDLAIQTLGPMGMARGLDWLYAAAA